MPSRTGRKSRRVDAIIPDSFIAGLYHRQVNDVFCGGLPTETLDGQPFKMVVIQSSTPGRSPMGLSGARHCHGSVLTVAAGITRLADLQATVRQIRHAGGTLLGTVLFDAPRIRLSFGFRKKS